MNRFEKIDSLGKKAKVSYRDGDYQILEPGDFVLCAVSGEQIALQDLKYWSVELQEAYVDAQRSLERHLEVLKADG